MNWEFGICANLEKNECWGNKWQRLFDIRRHNKQKHKIQFSNIKVIKGTHNEEILNRMQVQLTELRYGGGYRGVSMMSKPALFWPGLFHDSKGRSSSCYYSWIELLPQESLPPHKLYLRNLPFSNWPDVYKSPEFIFTHRLNFLTFKEVPGLPIPQTYYDLKMNHIPHSQTFCEFYPGGAGMKVSQYKYRFNQTFQEESVPIVKDWKSYHIAEDDLFIDCVQDGYSGPVISYWARLDDIKRSYFC